MNYNGIKYHKLTNSTIIFYEIDNHINSDIVFFEKIKILFEIVNNHKPKYLIINRIGVTNESYNRILEIQDILLIEDFKKYGLKNIFLIESEKESNKLSYTFISDFILKFNTMTEVFDYIKQPVFDASMSI